MYRTCIAPASPLHRPLPINRPFQSMPAYLCLFLPFFCFFGSHAPSGSHVHPILPLLVPLPQHWGHAMPHVSSPTLAMVPPPHTSSPATSTRVCAR